MRNPKRQPGPIRRVLVTGTDPAVVARQNRHTLAAPVTPITGATPRKPRTRKGQAGWDVSLYYKTRATIDARWSATVSNRAV